MKIAIDARELAGRRTGVGRYLSELLTEWSHSDAASKHEWLLYTHQPLRVPAAFAASVRLHLGSGGTQWEQVTLARALAADRPAVLFAPGYTAPLRVSLPVALTIHDASFFAHPEWFTFREGMRRRVLTRLSAARARVVLTDSAFSRDEIARHIGVPRGKIRVTYLGIRRQAAKSKEDTREPIVLFVGSIFRRRHVDTLIEAFATRVAPQVPGSRLEIVGDNRAYPPLNLERVLTLQSLEVQRRITVRSYVDDQTLADLYAHASVFAFPSEYEGFGLTPLEALSAGVPPVVLDTPIATEIYGGAAKYVQVQGGAAAAASTSMADRLGDAIVQLLTEQGRRNDVLRHAPDILSRYRWEKTAADVLAVLEEAAAHG
jgi:glycosyltransferase involved in cell wall biosynthesis